MTPIPIAGNALSSRLFFLGSVLAFAIRPLTTVSVAQPRLVGATEWERVSAVFSEKCTRCHEGDSAQRGLRLDSWEHLFQGSDFGEAVIAYDADNSLLVELATKYVAGSHPGELNEPALSADEVSAIRDWIDEGATSADGRIPFDDNGPRVYVANQGAAMVSVIDIETNQIVRTVDMTDLGFSSTSMPHHIAVEPDGSFWYVSLIMDNKILKFSRDNELVGQADVIRPGLLSLDPTGPWLYAARSMMSVSPPQSMVQIDRRDMSVEVIEVLMPRPHALATSRDGTRVYVSSLGMNRVATFDSGTGDIEFFDIPGDIPHVIIGFAISPDGNTMVATSEVTSKAFVFDLTSGNGLALTDTIGVLRAPWHPVYTANGKQVYFGNNWTNTVTVLDMDSRSVLRVIEGNGLAQPHGSAASADGRYVYISNRNLAMPVGHSKEHHVYIPRYDLGDNQRVGTVLVIDARTQEIVRVLETEEYASGMGTAKSW
jgi:YVTN family beta-propeller protein